MHENEPIGGTHFHMSGFTGARFDTETKGNSKMAFWRNVCNLQGPCSYEIQDRGVDSLVLPSPLPLGRSDAWVLFVTFLSQSYSYLLNIIY